MFTKRLMALCAECGSDDIQFDAWAKWCTDEQTFVLHSSHEQGYCASCDAIDVQWAELNH